MLHKVIQPQSALRAFVNNIMIFKVSDDASTEQRLMSCPPLPENSLFFYPFARPEVEYLAQNKKELLPNGILNGPQVNRVQITMPHKLTIKVGFQPGGLYRLLGVPLNEFKMDEALDSSYVFDKEIPFVNEQLCEATSYLQMIEIIEAFLLKKLRPLHDESSIDSVLHKIIASGGLMPMDDIKAQSGVSVRQLERLFQQRTGMSPKFFVRLTRFSKAWILKENNPQLRWTNIAYTCGYFDQMHLIRDFKEFAGVNPSVIVEEFKKWPFSFHHQLFY